MIRRAPEPSLADILRAFLVLVLVVVGIVACLVTSGCATRTARTPDVTDDELACPAHAYVLVIDEAFTESERAIVTRAAGDWSDATGGRLRLEAVRVEAIGDALDPCTVQVVRAEAPRPDVVWGATVSRGADARGRTGAARAYLSPRLRGRPDEESATRATAMHELGHAFGLDHAGEDDMGSCMWTYITDGCEITPSTRARLCDAWSCADGAP